jgi:hypothetical protein
MRLRISPSTVLSALALFFALGGTAIAARHYLITSPSQIKPSVLKQLHGAAGAAGVQGLQGPQGSSGAQGPAGAPGVPGASATALWATVSATGTLGDSSGVSEVVANCFNVSGICGPRDYTVTFNRDVSHCARIATLSAPSNGESGQEPGQIAISDYSLRNPYQIAVFTYNASGASQYRSFSVAVFC